MKNAAKAFTVLTLIFLGMLSVSGMLSGFVSDAVYVLAFLLPIGLGLCFHKTLKRQREETAGVAERERWYLTVSREGFIDLLPLIAPTVALIFLVSLLTSLLLGLLGVTSEEVADAPILEMLLVNALIPALLEEGLFRFIPMKLLSPYSRKGCIILSALFFALIHCNLFSIPYAFVAGLALILITLMTGSVIPSFILHLVNNAVSCVWIKYCKDGESMLIFALALGGSALLSLVGVFVRRRRYLALLRSIMKEDTLMLGWSPAVIIFITLFVAAVNLTATV